MLVYDANEMPSRQHAGEPYVVEFLEAHDVDPNLCYRFEILPEGDGQLVSYSFDPGILDADYPIPANLDRTRDGWELDVWRTEPIRQPLRVTVPRELMEVGR
jgi:hypothetical protein